MVLMLAGESENGSIILADHMKANGQEQHSKFCLRANNIDLSNTLVREILKWLRTSGQVKSDNYVSNQDKRCFS